MRELEMEDETLYYTVDINSDFLDIDYYSWESLLMNGHKGTLSSLETDHQIAIL